MKTKKFLLVLLVLVYALSLAACSKSSGGSGANSSDKSIKVTITNFDSSSLSIRLISKDGSIELGAGEGQSNDSGGVDWLLYDDGRFKKDAEYYIYLDYHEGGLNYYYSDGIQKEYVFDKWPDYLYQFPTYNFKNGYSIDRSKFYHRQYNVHNLFGDY